MSFPVRRTAVTLLLMSSLGFAACGGGGDKSSSDAGSKTDATATDGAKDSGGSAAAATINLKPATVEPADVSIKVGETVEWKWGGGVQHNIVGEGFKSELQSKGTFDHTFDTAGTFKYKCEVHPTTMMGTVTVA